MDAPSGCQGRRHQIQTGGKPAKKGFLGFTPMSPDTLEKKAWLFLQASSGNGRPGSGAKAGIESLNGISGRLRLQLDEACSAGYSPPERMKIDKMLSVYQGTFEQLRIYGQAFASLCGPRDILEQKSADVKSNADQQLQKPGIAGFLEKNVLPLAMGALTGGAAATTGFTVWAAAKLSGVLGLASPVLLQNAAAFIGLALAGAAVWLVSSVSKWRVGAIEKKRIASMQAIGKSEQEIKKAIVSLVVLEYQRLATIHSIKVGLPAESEATICRKMEQLVYEIKSRHGFELPLPAEVERAVWPLMHKKREGRLEKAGHLLHAHLEVLFGRRGEGDGANPWQHFEPKACCLDMHSLCLVA